MKPVSIETGHNLLKTGNKFQDLVLVQMTAAIPSQKKLLFYFILVWTAINILQACFTGLDGDEAYYWVYSLNLQWGYFDHPPLVALSIWVGELFGHGYLFTRFGTILFSAGTIYCGFKALPDFLQNARTYCLVFASVLIFHIYGFVVTPDSSLLFFTALFFYAYKQYLKNDGFKNILFLAFSMLGLIYSKYHGVLPVLFVFLSNPKLILRRSAWITVILVIIGFIPHLWWQYSHNWPTVQYHLFERSQGTYKAEKTTNYILGQLLIFGPFTTLPALILFFKNKKQDPYFKAHVFTFVGILVFFFFSSFKKNIEPHWTLTAGISFIVLLLHVLQNGTVKLRKVFSFLFAANIVLILAARVFLMIPNSPAEKIDRFQVQIYSASWADSLYKKAKGTPVVFVDNYHYPSLYKYHHPGELSTSYSTVYFRKTHYQFSNQSVFNNRSIFAIRKFKTLDTDIEVKSKYVPTFLQGVDSFKALSGLKIGWDKPFSKYGRSTKASITLGLSNPLHYSIDGNNLFLVYTFFKSKTEYHTSENIPFLEELKRGEKMNFTIEINLPEKPGTYRLIFSFTQPSMGPTFASPFYTIRVL